MDTLTKTEPSIIIWPSKVGVSPFCRQRHTKDSSYSHADVPLEEVANLLLYSHAVVVKEGYKPKTGRTIVLRVPDWCPIYFYSGITLIREDDVVTEGFRPRVEGELPRPFKEVVRDCKPRAKTVDLVFYNTTALAATGDNGLITDDPDNSWELVTILASEDDCMDSPPPTPLAVLANYLGCDGGTKTDESREEFTEHLNKSLDYWIPRASVVVR